MPEAKRFLATEGAGVRANQLLAHQTGKPQLDLRPQSLSGKRLHRPPVEHLALYGTALEQLALLDRQALQPGGEERLDRRRNLDRAPLARQREHLLKEQRITLAAGDHPRPRVGIEAVAE